MSDRTYALATALIGVICGFVIIRSFLFADSMTLRNDVVQGFFVGFGLAIVTIEIFARIKATMVNGWISMFGCGAGRQVQTLAARVYARSNRSQRRIYGSASCRNRKLEQYCR